MLSIIEHVHRHTENMAPWFPANRAPSLAEHETFDVHTCAEQHLIMEHDNPNSVESKSKHIKSC